MSDDEPSRAVLMAILLALLLAVVAAYLWLQGPS